MCCYLTALNVCQSSSFLLRCFFFIWAIVPVNAEKELNIVVILSLSLVIGNIWYCRGIDKLRFFFCWYACIIHWRAYFLLCAVMLSFISIFPTEYEYIDETQNRFFRVPLFKMLWVIVLYCTEQALIICGRNDGNSHIRCTQSLLWY